MSKHQIDNCSFKIKFNQKIINKPIFYSTKEESILKEDWAVDQTKKPHIETQNIVNKKEDEHYIL